MTRRRGKTRRPGESLDTIIVKHYIRVMKNITITLDEDTARWVRIRAAEHEKSVSRLLKEFLQEKMAEDRGYAQAMEAFLSVRPSRIRKNGICYPSRDKLHER